MLNEMDNSNSSFSDFDVEHEYRFTDSWKLDRLYECLDSCGTQDLWLLDSRDNSEFAVKVFCNLKACDNPLCIEHRGREFVRKHIAKVRDIQCSMERLRPIAWVFTDVKLSYPIDREYCQRRMTLLNDIMRLFSRTKYSIHMELKLHEDYVYLHFHVLSGGISDLSVVRRLWGMHFMREPARSPDVAKYVMKYASKTPTFFSEIHRNYYHLAVYKTRMHVFGSDVVEDKVVVGDSPFVLEERLFREIRMAQLQNVENWFGPVGEGVPRWDVLLEFKPGGDVCE